MELATINKPVGNNGCLAALFILLIFASVLVGGSAIISRAVADISDSAATVLVAKSEQSGMTARTGIERDGRVAIAEIQADATKKTSFAFILFWVTRLLAWVAAGIMTLVAVAWGAQAMGGNHEPTN